MLRGGITFRYILNIKLIIYHVYFLQVMKIVIKVIAEGFFNLAILKIFLALRLSISATFLPLSHNIPQAN